MTAIARIATIEDHASLITLYRILEAEMDALSPMWRLTLGLSEPVEAALENLLSSDDENHHLIIGEYEGYPFGFMLGMIETMLPQALGDRIGAIRLVFVEEDVRAVGVGEAMRDAMLQWFRERGLSRFDAHVLPGHRLAKNFFEQAGFSARQIVMHHADE